MAEVISVEDRSSHSPASLPSLKEPPDRGHLCQGPGQRDTGSEGKAMPSFPVPTGKLDSRPLDLCVTVTAPLFPVLTSECGTKEQSGI